MNTFIPTKTNVAAPSGYLSPESITSLTDLYGEDAQDAQTSINTIYCRQDTQDVNSRRACSLHNESPRQLKSGYMLITEIFPTTGIYQAVISGDLSGVQIIANQDLSTYLAEWQLPEEEL